MNNDPHNSERDTIEAMLRPARNSLSRAARRKAMKQAAALLAKILILAIGSIAAIQLLGRLRGDSLSGLQVYGAFGGLLGIAVFFAAGRAYRSMRREVPTSRIAAERLDQAHRTHNRVASSFDFIERGETSGFALAAIDDGLAQLRLVGDQPILAPQTRVASDRRIVGAAMVVSGAMVLFLTVSQSSIQKPTAPHSSIAGQPSRQTVSAAALPDDSEDPRKASRRGREESPGHQPSPQRVQLLAAASPDEKATTRAATMRARANAPASSENSGAKSAPATTTSSASSPGEPSRTNRPTAPRDPARAKSNRAAAPEEAAADASRANLSGNGSGAGRFKAVAGRGTQRENPPAAEAETMDEPGEIEESNSSNDQRGGIQPSLPDRTAAPSRELGITGPKSKRPGTGRGGPSPLKKSRGTAALLMGVPVPDFVRGRMGPGPVAVTVERTEPQENEGFDAQPTEARRRFLPETIVQHVDVPWSEAHAVRAYLRQWHGRDRSGAAGLVFEVSAVEANAAREGPTPEDENDS